MRKLSIVLAIGALALTTALASAQTALNLTFGPGRDATQPGTVTLTPAGNQTRVTIAVTAAGPSQPAHIHAGGCPAVGAVVFPLTNVANGASETTVNATLDTIQATQHSINIHRSPTEAGVYTACVNIPVRAASQAAPAARPAGATQLPRTGGPPLELLALLGTAFAGMGYALRRR
jgi:hypothetical protein